MADQTDDDGRGATPPHHTTWAERAALPFSGASAALFGVLSALRRARFFHPLGRAYTGRLHASDDHVLPATLRGRDHDVIARVSRGAGLREPFLDVLGLAIKVPGAGTDGGDQDLLLASSLDVPMGRNLLVPSPSFFTCTFSSVLPYRVDDEQVMFGARADPALRDRPGRLDGLDQAIADGPVTFALIAAPVTGAWRPIARIELIGRCSDEVSDALRFNPWNTSPELVPAGPLNRLRRSAYVSSQRARAATSDGSD